jgi:L-ascorbate metabolism protein UlaG (beta-lactamase superfamily)
MPARSRRPLQHHAPSDHCDGRKFHNHVRQPPQAREVVRWLLTRRAGAWPTFQDLPHGPPPPERVGQGELRVTLVNHATVLVQMDGLNFLTDPVWSERVSPVSFAGPRRRHPPGLRLQDLPPIDAVLVSHNHYDHLDIPTLRKLQAQHHPHVVAPLGHRNLLRRHRIGRVTELDWWHGCSLTPEVRVTCVPAQHFSNRGLLDRDQALWAGFVIEGPSGRVFFAGDTGFSPHFAEIRERLGPMRLALLPIGAYRPRHVLRHVHMDPAEAVDAHRALQASTSLAIHYGTFGLADDGQDEPLQELDLALQADVGPEAFWSLPCGHGRMVP